MDYIFGVVFLPNPRSPKILPVFSGSIIATHTSFMFMTLLALILSQVSVDDKLFCHHLLKNTIISQLSCLCPFVSLMFH
jgi:hypothetical protein